jgi:cytoskeleton protein RodZ
MSGQTLGSLLRQKRESLGLTLEKVEGSTRIRVKHLAAIESDDLSSIPSVPQARGFIRNYAAFLGVTPEEMAAATRSTRPRPAAPLSPAAPAADSSETRPRRTAPVVSRSAAYANTRPVPPRPQAKNFFRADTLLSLGVAAVVVALLGWGGYHVVMSLRSTTPAQPAAAASAAASATPSLLTAALTDTPAGMGSPAAAGADETLESAGTPPAVTPGEVSIATVSPTAFPTPLGGVYTDVRIRIEILQRAYLEVEVDGKIYRENGLPGRVLPGQTFEFAGRQTVKISTGNGAGIRVIFNGVDEGAIGRFGEVIILTYTPTGVVTPVPSATPTPTVTPTGTVAAAPG